MNQKNDYSCSFGQAATPTIYFRNSSAPAESELRDSLEPLSKANKRRVGFEIGVSGGSADLLNQENFYQNHADQDVEDAWEDLYRNKPAFESEGCWTETSSMIPEVNSVARLQDVESMASESTPTSGRAGFRPVATYGGGHLR